MANYLQIGNILRGDASVDAVPTASSYTNLIREDTNTGRRYYSNGISWIELNARYGSLVTKTAAYTATDLDEVILVDATTAGFTLSLPTASGRTGKILKIRRIDLTANNIVIIDPSGSETIDGLLTYELRTQFAYVEIRSDGTNWQIIDYSYFDINAYKRLGTANNRWYIPGMIGASQFTALTVSANILYAQPLILGRIATINDLGINVTTGVASTEVKIGIYKDNGAMQPSSLLYDTGALATTTSSTFVSHALTTPLKLQPGLYWIVFSFNGTPSVRFVPLAGQVPLLGGDNVAATTGTASSYYKSNTHPTGAMPDPYPASPSYNHTAQIPCIYVRFV